MLSLVLLSLNILSFWTYGLTHFLKVGGIISPPIRHFRFSIFLLETLELEWQCSQYLEFNPTCVINRIVTSYLINMFNFVSNVGRGDSGVTMVRKYLRDYLGLANTDVEMSAFS